MSNQFKMLFVIILSISPMVVIGVFLFKQVKGTSNSTSGSAASSSSAPSVTSQPSGSDGLSLTVPSASLLPSQTSLPLAQQWCESKIFCPGSVLQTVDIANVYADQKTFVDKPTSKSSQDVLAAFQNISSSQNVSSSTTYGDIATFLENNFAEKGQELQNVVLPPTDYNVSPGPPFFNNITSTKAKAFASVVHGYWGQLFRTTNTSSLCNQCESTFIPLNNTFVIPGGNIREQYYLDNFWIVEGLLQSQVYSVVKFILQNLMDQLENFNFIPYGSRTYYLNRSNPPLFIQMLNNYVQASNDTSILTRALPLAEREMQWWDNLRSVQVTSPSGTFKMYHHNVTNSAPRPESYLADYLATPANLTDFQKANFYAELASLTETGWSQSTRWTTGSTAQVPLNVRSIIGPDLNSIMYKNLITLAGFYGPNSPNAISHNAAAANLRNGILELLWDPVKLAFYDYNLNTNTRSPLFSAATFYPFWSGIIPDEVANNQSSAFRAFASINMVMYRYNGTFPATFAGGIVGATNIYPWDGPNAWPPHQYVALQALRALPPQTIPVPKPATTSSTFSLIPLNQLNVGEGNLKLQPDQITPVGTGPPADKPNDSTHGTVVNGGNVNAAENWSQTLQRELANRFFASVLCNWLATGGVLPGSGATQSNGIIYEKYSTFSVNTTDQSNGAQDRFGWTNGVLLWIAKTYATVLVDPKCNLRS